MMTALILAVTISGCPVAGSPPGTVGLGDLSGAPGDTVTVPVNVHTNALVEAYMADLLFPESVELIGADHGDLTQAWSFVGASGLGISGQHGGRFGGFGVPGVPENVSGELCRLHFAIIGDGDGDFTFLNKFDGIETYEDKCETSTSAPGGSWGRTKAWYR